MNEKKKIYITIAFVGILIGLLLGELAYYYELRPLELLIFIPSVIIVLWYAFNECWNGGGF